MKLIVASNIPHFKESLVNNGYDVVAEAKSTDELQRLFGSTEALGNILLVTEKMEIKGSLINILLDIHEHFPEVRIIFLATGDLTNRFTVNQLYLLASSGIYDLFYEGKITIGKIKHLIDNPKLQVDCMEIFEAYKENNRDGAPIALALDKDGITADTAKDNVVAVTSVKPGTGKSFVSSNLAVTLARYGKKPDGSRIKVLLLEGDLQTLSVTTLFNARDEEHNLKTALKNIEDYLDSHDHDANQWFTGASNVKKFINQCCLRTSMENLYVLEGHNFDFNDIADCDGEAYYYLVDYLASQFDEVVIDSNSSLQHPTTDPILQLSKTLYFVFTTEFNNIKLNVRYQNELAKLGVADKIKYVLNKTLMGEQKQTYTFEYSDKEIIGDKIKIDYEIPLVDMAVILNSTYRHHQIAMDNEFKTLMVRIKFLQLANDVIPLGHLDDLKQQVKTLRKQYKNKK